MDLETLARIHPGMPSKHLAVYKHTLPWLLTDVDVGLLCLQARIKKIMQTDEEIGKVAAAVPVIICIIFVCASQYRM